MEGGKERKSDSLILHPKTPLNTFLNVFFSDFLSLFLHRHFRSIVRITDPKTVYVNIFVSALFSAVILFFSVFFMCAYSQRGFFAFECIQTRMSRYWFSFIAVKATKVVFGH